MCGLVGVLNRDGSVEKGRMEAALRTMSDQIVHRGPDGSGTWTDGTVGFAHRRLAIIDLNERSNQPMHTADGKLTIVYNGETYNFMDLRAELEALGHRFQTESDTEVLLYGYRQWGDDLPSKMRGMFAFAIWDHDKQELFLARDRFGKKPLVYAWCGDALLFGSEVKSLLEWPGFERRTDLRVIHDYLSFGYTPGVDTAFLGVKRLPPAHHLRVTPRHGPGNPPSPQRYWRLAEVDPAKGEMTRDQAAGEFLERFDEALRMRLISDVPLGAFLSGGVDSSAVVARMSAFVREPIKTFSVGFDVAGFDETAWAREVAERYETEHHSFKMDYGLIDTLPEIIWHYGEPFSDSSALVSTALSHKIRQHVTVALTGDGGDEIFLGYSRYDRFQTMIAGLGDRGESLRQKIVIDPEGTFGRPTIRDRYIPFIDKFRDRHKQWGYGPALIDYLLAPSSDRLPAYFELADDHNAIDIAARAEVDTYLPDDLLIKADIATMAASVEGRSPFLDHELADWAASLPQHLRVFERNGRLEMKALLKYAMEPQLSEDVLYRDKQGFAVPVQHWLRYEIRDLVGDLLTSKAFRERGYLRPEFTNWMLDQHFKGHEDHGTRLWNLLCLELWHRTFTDRRESGPLDIDVGAPDAFEQVKAEGVAA